MNRIPLFAAIVALSATMGCDTQALDDLETRVATLEENAKNAPVGKQPPAADPNEQLASGLLKEASLASEAMKYDEAKAKVAELKAKYPNTRSARAASRLEDELTVIGVDAGDLQIEKWYQGSADLSSDTPTLVVFWEVWCPHCKREVPKMNKTHNKYKDKGLNVVGLTKITRNSTEEQVLGFIKEEDVQYSLAKEDGDNMSKRFGVSGIPAAAVVKDGTIVWRGHPARLTDEMIQGWL